LSAFLPKEPAMAHSLRLERIGGRRILDFLPALARLRITVFRDFPYLYDGSEAYERSYLQTYIDAPDSVMVLVLDGDELVGASSGIPLADEVAELRRPFEQSAYPPERVFYCGESVLLPAYRGRGLGVRFFEEREAHARALGRFELICFAAVQRPAEHPRRPAGYLPLDDFWQRRGYRERPELATTFSWQDLDEPAETPKPMVFWTKELNR
jgi:GNAT superfamily N-acetyltransferase